MNRRSALDVIFNEEEAGQVSDDELSDQCEEESDYEDEINYSELAVDINHALDLEQDLLAVTSCTAMARQEPEGAKKRGRPRKNPPPKTPVATTKKTMG